MKISKKVVINLISVALTVLGYWLQSNSHTQFVQNLFARKHLSIMDTVENTLLKKQPMWPISKNFEYIVEIFDDVFQDNEASKKITFLQLNSYEFAMGMKEPKSSYNVMSYKLNIGFKDTPGIISIPIDNIVQLIEQKHKPNFTLYIDLLFYLGVLLSILLIIFKDEQFESFFSKLLKPIKQISI